VARFAISVLVTSFLFPAAVPVAHAEEREVCSELVARFEQWLCEERKAPVITLARTVEHNQDLPFIPHHGPGRFDSALVMNVRYAPISQLRSQMEKVLGNKMDFLKLWDPAGEAHVTILTPLEYHDVLRSHLPVERIEEMARQERLQEAVLKVVGLGCGRANLDGKMEETYFVIVRSEELLQFRQKVHSEFTALGGSPEAWDPRHFYPHITVGYTKRDLHEADGVLKDMVHSFDPRFNLSLR
jgi:2'-5' RNA ligase